MNVGNATVSNLGCAITNAAGLLCIFRFCTEMQPRMASKRRLASQGSVQRHPKGEAASTAGTQPGTGGHSRAAVEAHGTHRPGTQMVMLPARRGYEALGKSMEAGSEERAFERKWKEV